MLVKRRGRCDNVISMHSYDCCSMFNGTLKFDSQHELVHMGYTQMIAIAIESGILGVPGKSTT